jgi:outer membrane protein OmpA-like peptidoglycan-associated protein
MVLKMIRKNFKISLLALVLSGSLVGKLMAQSSQPSYADKQYALSNYRLAADAYVNIYSAKPTYVTAKKAAQSLDAIYSFTESYEWWKKTVQYPAATKEDYAALIRSGLRTIPNYDPAQDLRNSEYSGSDFEVYDFGNGQTGVKYRVYEINPLDELNSKASDYSLSATKTGIQYFASNRGEESIAKKAGIRFDAKGSKISRDYYKSDGKSYYGLYFKSPGGELKSIIVEGYELFHLTDPQVLDNGMLIFTATPNVSDNQSQVIYPGVFYGTLDVSSGIVKDVKAFPYNQTNAFAVISPRIDLEQKRLYFSSNRPGGEGGYDLYYVNWDSDMSFSEPVNLGQGINSPANERDLVRVGNQIYFASDRKGGFGGLDVYQASISGDTVGEVTNMGLPVNSPADDFGFINTTENSAYLSSDRVGGQGFDDLYKVEWKDRSLSINVLDHDGKSLKEGTRLQLMDGLTLSDISTLTDEGLLNMTQLGNSYTFIANKDGYFTQKVSIERINEQEEVTLVMTPIPYGLEVYQKIIYYDIDKDFLRELSKENLDEITSYLSKHPELNLVIESHTDSRATDRYNQKLSERRARSVTKYLEERGVSSDRVRAAWFSEAKLVNDCGDGIPCPDLAHQLNRRSELKLIAFPEQNLQYEWPIGAEDLKTEDDFRNFFGLKK